MAESHPRWIDERAERRVQPLRLLADTLPGGVLEGQARVIVMPLTEPPEAATDEERARWERTCDNCGAYCPGVFHSVSKTSEVGGVTVVVVMGACPDCAGMPV